MEPLDTNYEYVPQQSANPQARFNWLLIVPVLGVIWLLFLLAAALFQWDITSVVNSSMSFMLFFFFIVVGLFFWAMAPRAKRK